MIENTTVDGSQINQLRTVQDLTSTARILDDNRNFSEKLDIQSCASTNSRPGSLEDIREEEKDSNVSNSVAPNLKRLDTLILDISEDANGETEQPQYCRFCSQFGTKEALVSVCECIGQKKYTHLSCLKAHLMRNNAVRTTHDKQITTFTWLAFHCNQCTARYPSTVNIEGENKGAEQSAKLIQGVVKRPPGDYIILESINLDEVNQFSKEVQTDASGK